MSMMKIKRDDTVRVTNGKDKGKEGKVLVVNRKKNTVIVEGVHMVTKHTKANAENQTGGIVKQEAPIDASNVMYLHKGKPTRIGFRFEDGRKVRFAKSTGETIV